MKLKLNELIKESPGRQDFTGVQPFIFEEPNYDFLSEVGTTDTILATPFRKFSIEVSGNHKMPLKLPRNELSNEFISDLGPREKEVLFEEKEVLFGDFGLDIIYCEEVAPGQYKFIAMTAPDKRGDTSIYTISNGSFSMYKIYQAGGRMCSPFTWEHIGRAWYSIFTGVVSHMLKNLHTHQTGTVKTSGKARYKNSTGRRVDYRASNVIYISKKIVNGSRTSCGTIIRKTESWAVRAHWRKIASDTLGLDRLGERTVRGYTWISPQIRGNKSVTPTRKIRKVS